MTFAIHVKIHMTHATDLELNTRAFAPPACYRSVAALVSCYCLVIVAAIIVLGLGALFLLFVELFTLRVSSHSCETLRQLLHTFATYHSFQLEVQRNAKNVPTFCFKSALRFKKVLLTTDRKISLQARFCSPAIIIVSLLFFLLFLAFTDWVTLNVGGTMFTTTRYGIYMYSLLTCRKATFKMEGRCQLTAKQAMSKRVWAKCK